MTPDEIAPLADIVLGDAERPLREMALQRLLVQLGLSQAEIADVAARLTRPARAQWWPTASVP